MNIELSGYQEQNTGWPSSGRHILAQYDEDGVIVYQAFNSAIGEFAAKEGRFGGDFRYSRMSWIKPNFLWMMYRSSWGTAVNQEVILAVRIKRTFFDSLLAMTVPTSYHPACYPTPAEWRAAGSASDVRLQWDPDHTPTGGKRERRAIQMGLRGDTLREYGNNAILEIGNISQIVAEGRELVRNRRISELRTPTEKVYRPWDESIANRIGLAQP